VRKYFSCLISYIYILALLIIGLAVSGCTNLNAIRRNKLHTVKKGETLCAIARQHNMRLDRLAKANGIRAPYKIVAGQRLTINRTTARDSVVATKRNTKQPTKQLPGKQLAKQSSHQSGKQPSKQPIKQANQYSAKPINKQPANQAVNKSNQPIPQYSLANKNWTWPAQGRILKNFTASGPGKINGVAISGKKGAPVVSTANGRVVYSGNSLRGYGNLVIIKHDQDFLSAYAHNDKILVAEQQEVKQGQQIATMGDSESKDVLLHFEIRYKGKPVDPKQVLASR
jgi:lipoprotein NlpD